MTTICDNEIEVYVNGVLEETNDNWRMASTVHLGVPPVVVAIHCVDNSAPGGILAHLSNGEGTDETWKCSDSFEEHWNQISFDDSGWDDGYEIIQYPGGIWGSGVSGMTGNPYWIWTNDWTDEPTDKTVYCRKTIQLPLELSQCKEDNGSV